MLYEQEQKYETKWYTVHESCEPENNWCVVSKQWGTVEYSTDVLPAAMDVAQAYSDNLDRLYTQGADVVGIGSGTIN